MADSTPQNIPTQGRRRSSIERYADFMKNKAPQTHDPQTAAFHNSIHDQKPKSGMFGKMWATYIKGHPAPAPANDTTKK